MKNFRTYRSAVEFYRIANAIKLPRHLKEQLTRAAASIALNLAEGRAKPTLADQVRFFHIAFGSVRECQAILELAQLTRSPAWFELDKVAAQLYRLIKEAA